MRNKSKKELAVCGLEAVKALCEKNPSKVKRLYFTSEIMKIFGDACRELSKRKAPYNVVEEADLEKLCGSVHHQGVVAMIDEFTLEPLSSKIVDEWLHKKEDAVLLDRIGNANNFGAIVRSAAFFGIKNIVIPMDEMQSTVTTSSYRVAQGGMEVVKVYSVKSEESFLKSISGKMLKIGTDLKATKSCFDLRKLREKNKPFLIILGNEEKGISEKVRKQCDETIIIKGSGNVESLNVAQAASIIFYSCM